MISVWVCTLEVAEIRVEGSETSSYCLLVFMFIDGEGDLEGDCTDFLKAGSLVRR